jgi:hypothetical protein
MSTSMLISVGRALIPMLMSFHNISPAYIPRGVLMCSP